MENQKYRQQILNLNIFKFLLDCLYIKMLQLPAIYCLQNL